MRMNVCSIVCFIEMAVKPDCTEVANWFAGRNRNGTSMFDYKMYNLNFTKLTFNMFMFAFHAINKTYNCKPTCLLWPS